MPHPRTVSKKPEGQPTRGKTAANRLRRVDNFILPGGLMIEGTSTPYGQIWCANVVKREERGKTDGWNFEALVFGTNFRLGFEITDFQAVLPKNSPKWATGSTYRKSF